MQLTTTVNLVEAVWVPVALFGLVYGLVVLLDGRKDQHVRHAAQMNSGKEDMARLVVVCAGLMTAAFTLFLLAGLLAMTIPSAPTTTPKAYAIQSSIVAAEILLAACLYYQQRVRRRVLLRDMDADAVRLAAAALLAGEQREALTAATRELTVATQEQTLALQNDPLHAQLAQTQATEELTASTDELRIATDENTAVLDVKTQAEITKREDEGR